ncbi:MAG: 23S rRNA (guanosine(2251)-2'-O)-methyltransferase RlmB [Clostridia bacterium]|jgi:23S rRNA (guanosine2251-2'-O)-methyltransferase|nr:23S rRNA (guanosine(2251)-2'-O)-methyltransferase RlmB [Clostridia bacterium]
MKIMGKNAVSELIKTDKTVDKILVQNGLRDDESRKLVKDAKNRGYKVQFAEKAVLDKECESKRHQGFIAFTSDFKYTEFEDLLSGLSENAFLVVADGIEDPHNLGSIIRVCECAGVEGLVIGKHRSAQVTDAVMRISEGSANHLKIARVVNINTAVEKIKEAGLWTFALELGGSDIYKTDLKGKLCLVIGGEDTGVNKLTKQKCDGVITIPMSGKVNSLNASVALGVGVFEAVRQRSL